MITVQRTSEVNKIPNTKKAIMLLMLTVLIGVLIGTIVFCNMSTTDIASLSFITQGFIKNRTEQIFFETFKTSFISSGMLILICFLFGFSAIAQPAELLIPFFRGIGLGTSIAYIYASYGLRGFFITLVLILPHAVISSVAVIFSVRESIRLSNLFSSYAFSSGSDIEMRSSIKLYILKFLILFVIIGISSFIDSILTSIFAGILF